MVLEETYSLLRQATTAGGFDSSVFVLVAGVLNVCLLAIVCFRCFLFFGAGFGGGLMCFIKVFLSFLGEVQNDSDYIYLRSVMFRWCFVGF